MRLLLYLICLLPATAARGTTYYFSSTLGDDRRSHREAQHPSSPWRSIEKLNTLFGSLKPGDSVLLRRGDVFEGTIVAAASGRAGQPIVVAAWGKGPAPVVSGLMAPGPWKDEGQGIYTASLYGAPPRLRLVLRGGRLTAMGRHPNADAPQKGYLTLSAPSAVTEIRATALDGQPDWTGAEAVIRTRHWIIDHRRIRQASPGRLLLDSAATEAPQKGFGFFIQDDPRTLDQEGEWYHDRNLQQLRICAKKQAPALLGVEVARRPTLLVVRRQQYLHFESIFFRGANDYLVELDQAEGITIRNCRLAFGGVGAIRGRALTNSLLEANMIHDQHNDGIYLSGNCSSNILRNNTIRNILLFPGMCRSGNTTGLGIYANGAGHRVMENRLDSCGFTPIRFGGDNVLIHRNLVTRFNFIKDDEGGIYTWNNNPGAPLNKGRVISENIVLHGIGAKEGTPGHARADGIYLDDNSGGVEITGNTVAWCSHHGIYIHDAHHTIIRNNLCFANRRSQVTYKYDEVAPNGEIRNMVLEYNILFSQDAGVPVLRMESIRDDIRIMGTANNNLYARPDGPERIIDVDYRMPGGVWIRKRKSLSEWQQFSAQDARSRQWRWPATAADTWDRVAQRLRLWPHDDPGFSGSPLRLEYNPGGRTRTISLQGNWQDLEGRPVRGKLTLPPFRSAILVRRPEAKNGSEANQ